MKEDDVMTAMEKADAFDEIKDFTEKHMETSWEKMGDTGSNDYVFNEENFYCGYYRALEDILSIIEKVDNVSKS